MLVNDSRVREDSVLFAGLKMNKRKLAKLGYVAAAGASFLFSISLWFTGSKQEGVYVGLWVPSILSFGTLVLGSSDHAK